MKAAEIAFRLHGRKSGAGYVGRCPAHDDHEPSLSLRDGDDGRVLVHCHAGCEQTAIIGKLKDLGLWEFREPELSFNQRIECAYPYTDESGRLLYEVVRLHSPKSFLQRYPNGSGGWVWKKHQRQVLYNLPEVLRNQIIFICEGEKDCETFRSHGFVATCEAGGANAPWPDSYTQALARPVLIEGEEFRKEVIILPDSDKPGRQRALRIAKALKGKVYVRIASMEDEPGIKDISDWFAAGHSEVELIYLLEKGVTQ
jgi:putative DNA primase/helicase